MLYIHQHDVQIKVTMFITIETKAQKANILHPHYSLANQQSNQIKVKYRMTNRNQTQYRNAVKMATIKGVV